MQPTGILSGKKNTNTLSQSKASSPVAMAASIDGFHTMGFNKQSKHLLLTQAQKVNESQRVNVLFLQTGLSMNDKYISTISVIKTLSLLQRSNPTTN